jgi:hypothetical protein
MMHRAARIATAVLVERLPKCAPPLQHWEVSWELAVRKRTAWRLQKAPEWVRKDLEHFICAEFLDAFYDGETYTNDDKTDNNKSTNRRLHQTLFLVIKEKNGNWTLPSVECKPEESVREAAERSIKEHFKDELQVYFTGIAPLAHQEIQHKDALEKVICTLIDMIG